MLCLKIFTVSELSLAIKNILEPSFYGLSVQGEISNLKIQSSGHIYFTLKDASSQISAVLFRGNTSSLSRLPKDGDEVILKGEISVYTPRGQYQMIVRELSFTGLGELLLKFHQTKERLAQKGWFDPERKKPLPKLPKIIGVITSPTGAVIQDILHILSRRFAGFQVILNPVKVQGEGAKEEIAKAIADFNRYQLADVIILGRGGGSIEDLWAFNEEIVAQAIFESKIPIISAVGHETDFTIADWVSDLRAPTPSAAAEMVIAEKEGLVKIITTTKLQLSQKIFQEIRSRKEKLKALRTHPIFSSPYAILSKPIQQLDAMRASLEVLKPSKKISQLKDQFKPYLQRTTSGIFHLLQQKKERLISLQSHLLSMHPNHLVKKGFAILFSKKDGSVMLSVKDFQLNQPFTAQLQDGSVTATVKEITEYEPRDSGF